MASQESNPCKISITEISVSEQLGREKLLQSHSARTKLRANHLIKSQMLSEYIQQRQKQKAQKQNPKDSSTEYQKVMK